jgi:hypothetical protein
MMTLSTITGDREKRLGLPVSSLCDRRVTRVADIQTGDFNYCFFLFYWLEFHEAAHNKIRYLVIKF